MLHAKCIITIITQISVKMEEKPPFYLVIENEDIEMIKLFLMALKLDFDNPYRKHYYDENDKNKKDNKKIVRRI